MHDSAGFQRDGPDRQAVEHIIEQLIALSTNEEACRLLGVDGVLAEQLDLTFLQDPLDYVSYDIASAISDSLDSTPITGATMLPTLAAELRLCRLLGVRLDQHDLVQRVVELLRGIEA